MRGSSKIISLALLLTFALAACAPEPEFAPTPTPTAQFTENTGEATPTPIFAVEANTPVPAQDESDNLAASYPLGPGAYPADVNPLTGLVMDDPAALNRLPLAVKISNVPLSRPQSGLTYADAVWEHYAEGEVTRFTAIYYSDAPEVVGSLRSGRLIDLELVPMYDALYVASGFSSGVYGIMQTESWVGRNFSSPFGYEKEPYMVRLNQESRAYEHTLYVKPAEFWSLAAGKGHTNPPDMSHGMTFDTTPPAGGTPVNTVTLQYAKNVNTYEARWEYNPEIGEYCRWQAGEPMIDDLNGQQICADNVIAIGAMHIETTIREDSYNGLPSIEIQLWGEGPASLFRDGYRIEGSWMRSGAEDMMSFTTLDGNVLTFRPGNTWFEVVPIGFDRLTTE